MAHLKIIIGVICMLLMSASAEQVFKNGNEGSSQNYDGSYHNCGDVNTVGEGEYLTWDSTYLCLVFELKG